MVSEKYVFAKLDKLLLHKKGTIINWLKTAKVDNNYISGGLLDDKKLKIITETKNGTYNVILKWFIINKDKFRVYYHLFKNIPSTNFIDISNISLALDSSASLELNFDKALKKWKENPHKNPYDNSNIKISIVPSSPYGLLYEKFCNYLTSNLERPILPITFEKEIRNKLPNNHIYVFKDIDYIEKLKSNYPDAEWIKFLDTKKNLFYKNEKINSVTGSTVYDFLFMHFFLKKNEKKFDENVVIDYIDKQMFLYETIVAQITHIKAIDLNCYEIFKSMVYVGSSRTGDNFKLIYKKTKDKWSYEIPPLLKLFVEYINEITYYILPISNLNKIIYNDYFLYGKKLSQIPIPGRTSPEVIYNLMTKSIEYNIYRLKTIINIIFSSLYTNNGNKARINIKEFLNILFFNISECIGERNDWSEKNNAYKAGCNKFITINNILAYTKYKPQTNDSYKIDEYKFKMFFVSAIFDIKTLHEESYETNNTKYEFIKDPYDNLPSPPQMPKPVIISQALQRYKMTSHIVRTKPEKEKELQDHINKEQEYKKKLKEYNKKLKEYNDKYLGKKLSPYFSVKLSRAKSVINNKNSLRLSYTPLKVTAKSLTNFKSKKNKELLAKFEKEPYSRTYIKKEIEIAEQETQRIERFREARRQGARQRIDVERQSLAEIETQRQIMREREQVRDEPSPQQDDDEPSPQPDDDEPSPQQDDTIGGGSKEKLSESDLKLKLALEAHKFKEFAKLSPSGKSPRQKYIECDLNDNDPITQEQFSNMHFKKIKYLSKIKTTLPNGKIITKCYDTIPLYNYILDCNNKGIKPINIAQGKEPFDILQLDEVYKKIKFFTKQPTLERNIDTAHKIFLKTLYLQPGGEMYGLPYYIIGANISIGSVLFPVSHDNFTNPTLYPTHLGRLARLEVLSLVFAPIISRDDILFEDTSDNTALLIEQGVEKGSLLKVNKYPYWHKEGIIYIPNPHDFLILPPFSWNNNDSFNTMKERTHVLNNEIERLI